MTKLDDGPDTGQRPNNEQDIIKTLLKLNLAGLANGTIEVVDYHLGYLSQRTDLTKPEEVKAFISQMTHGQQLQANKSPMPDGEDIN